MSTKHRKLVNPLWLITLLISASACAAGAGKEKPKPLVLQEQGSFAVGGTVITAPGTYDPIKQGAYNPTSLDPQGQTLHGDHAYVFY